MSLWHLAWRYVWNRPLVTALTLVGVALGAALIAGVLTIRRETERTFLEESATFDLVVGAKGSPLQLVLSSVYHLDQPTGNIPYARYEALAADPRVREAVPIGLGDNFRGFRIVGTTPGFFDLQSLDPMSRQPSPLFEFAVGEAFDEPFEAVLGSEVARQTGLGLGAEFAGSHGLASAEGADLHGERPYTVVGILAPSGTSNDRAIFTPLESVWLVHGHEEEAHDDHAQEAHPHEEHAEEEEDEEMPAFFFAGAEPEAEREREVTAVLVQLQSVGMRLWIADEIRKRTEAMAAIPVNEMLRLYQQVLAPMQRTLLAVAYLVVVVAALSVLTTLYQAAERRRRDVAVMRSLGAHPAEIFLLVLLEALLLTLLGIALGWTVGHGAVQIAAYYLREQMGLAVQAWTLDATELRALAVVAAAGILAGVVPATLAYRRPPADDLGRA